MCIILSILFNYYNIIIIQTKSKFNKITKASSVLIWFNIKCTIVFLFPKIDHPSRAKYDNCRYNNGTLIGGAIHFLRRTGGALTNKYP